MSEKLVVSAQRHAVQEYAKAARRLVLGHKWFDGFPGLVGPGADLTPSLDLLSYKDDGEFLSLTDDIREILRVNGSYSASFHENLLSDSDWRFSLPSLELIASQLAGKRALLVGMPTVHSFLEGASDNQLVDVNDVYTHSYSERLIRRTYFQDIGGGSIPDFYREKFEHVAFDAPWQVRDIDRWIRVAGTYLATGGALLMTMFSPSVRPSARGEMRAFGGELRKHFRSSSFAMVLYDTPTFEAEMFSVRGVAPPSVWRTGFILKLEGYTGTIARSSAVERPTVTPLWDRRVREDGRVVAVRTGFSGRLTDERFLDSVSSRDPFAMRYLAIDSRNIIRIGS